MDPLAELMSMDFCFEAQDASQLSLVQILIILSGMFTGEEPDDKLITAAKKRWWRSRDQAKNKGEIGAAMEIRWEPFAVIGVETLDYSPTTLAGVVIDRLASIRLLVSPL